MTSLPPIITIPRLLASTASRYPDRIAIKENEISVTYEALHQQALTACRALMASGVEKGDRVAIWAPNTSTWIVAALAIHCAGGALVPLNTRMRGSEAGYVLASSGARVLFSVGNFLGSYYPSLLKGHEPETLERIVVLDEAREEDVSWQRFLESAERVSIGEATARAEAVLPDDLSDIMFTSGTTGHPKGVMTGHSQNLRAIAGWADAMELTESDRYLIVNPFFHAMGYKAGWLAALMRGATILPQQVFDTSKVLETIEQERITVFPGPPTIFHSLLADPRLSNIDLSSLRATITGSTTIPPTLIERMRSELGFSIVLTGYGLTESCGFATLSQSTDPPETVASTCGRVMPGMELKLVDALGNVVPPGSEGEVCLRGYNVMKGYQNNTTATAEAVDDEGWLHTGDVGILDERGYLRITDRLKDMFIVGGFNCYPAEIERIASSHPAISQIAIVGVPDERMGEVGRAFVVLRPENDVSATEFIAWCRDNMANYKVPRHVSFVDALPTNPSGKVLKRDLRLLPLTS
ncbi:FadD3 family acyl-CoA ligase [Paraburkholderia sacchari]|uniref:FadD3 family acyl-CoA ligase n=1 Tax=Paraburkholderia sacchari TaxID=159450 RepID=UPI000542A73A|nr:FadD3 family acyl-CoA ligase [Paraburkholderia sacchari]NLP64872.1 fatty acid--CoA ligase family protein [Paraburkholderia sacchari]